MEEKKLYFIYNPHSGREQIRAKLFHILQIFSDAGYELTVHPTREKKDAVRQIEMLSDDYDLVVCNPPYFPPNSGPPPKGKARRTARTEQDCTLEDVCGAASRLLRWGGALCLVHKPERLADLFCALRPAGLEPKRLRLVSPRPEAAPSLVLLEACRGGKPGLAILPPLILESDGAPTEELNRIYFRT